MKTFFKTKASLLLALLGIFLSVIGIYFGEDDTVFEKAARICLECIGIG